MQALLLTDYRKLELTDIPKPQIGPNDVLVQVEACGICGSDVHGYDGSSGRRIPPIVMGHEAAGVLAEVGANVDLVPGTRVTFDSMISCGQCRFCRTGQINLCDNRNVLGVSCGEYRRHGAFAEYVTVPQHIVYPIPDELDFATAAMIEAVSVAVHAVNITPIKLGETALVVGAGMIGLLTVQALRLKGCAEIWVADLCESRLELARQIGATRTISAKEITTTEQVLQWTNGQGVDIAMEAVGADATVQSAIASVCKGGTVTLIGNITPEVTLPLQSVVTREVRLQGSCASSGEYPECIGLLAKKRIDVEPLITAKIPLADAPTWFDRLYSGEAGLLKVIVEPQQ